MNNQINQDINIKRAKDNWALLPLGIIKMAVEAFTYGAKKYSPDNWKKLNSEDYYSAMFRHLESFVTGQTYDEESKLHHLSHFLASVIMYIYLVLKEKDKQ